MKMIVCSVNDSLAGFGTILTFPSSELAIRDFRTFVLSSDSVRSNYLDYSLYAIGSFDTVSGTLTADDPVKLYTGADALKGVL